MLVIEHVCEAKGVAASSDALCTGAENLRKAAKAVSGIAPSAWIYKAQIEEAKRLLADPEMSVTLVALRLGMKESTFYAKFKRLTGQTPNEWRNSRL